MFAHFPSQEQWVRLADDTPYEMTPLIAQIEYTHGPKDYVGFKKSQQIEALVKVELQNRWADAYKSYVLTMFYFEMGIPDREWADHDGPGIMYFPHFEDRHFHIKEWFDYFSDI